VRQGRRPLIVVETGEILGQGGAFSVRGRPKTFS
jgi:hypothetical protein